MPSTTAPTVSSRVTTTSVRPVMPTRTLSSGSVMKDPFAGADAVRLQARAALPRRPLDCRAPGAPQVDAAEQEQPNDVDEMPVPGRELEPDVMARRKLAGPSAREANEQENHADDDVRAMKAGRHEEGRAIDRILEGEW